jgi:phage shock protein C
MDTMATTKKTLRRLPKQGQIAGVCAGLADYLELDVTLMRVLFVILAFVTGGTFIILYIILAIILPVGDNTDALNNTDTRATESTTSVGDKVQQLGQELQQNRGISRVRNYFGISLLVFGAWLLAGQFFPEWFAFRWDYVWPILLIVTGLLIVTKRRP